MSSRRQKMANNPSTAMSEAALWVKKWDYLIPADAEILDYACGAGRNAYYLLKSCVYNKSRRVYGVDIDTKRLYDTLIANCEEELIKSKQLMVYTHDLTKGLPQDISDKRFDVLLWINYLSRTAFQKCIIENVRRDGGLVIFQSFVVYPDGTSGGSVEKKFPMNPDHLLKPNEIIMLAAKLKIEHPELGLEILSYETGVSGSNDKLPRYAERMVLRLNGTRDLAPVSLP